MSNLHTCTRCKQAYPFTVYWFPRDADGELKPICRDCHAALKQRLFKVLGAMTNSPNYPTMEAPKDDYHE